LKRILLATVLVALAASGAASASEQHPTLAELERELICPTCHETLAVSTSPIADRMRSYIRVRIAAGDTKSEIKASLVDQFGEGVLAAPPKRGFNLLAWLLPLVGLTIAAAVIALLARRWSSGRGEPGSADPSGNGRAPIDPELERRLDEELARFDA
jgi:cytochrome c-type biogenesis protein CcmH